MNKRLFLRISVVVILFISFISPLSLSNAQESVDISLRRTFGMAFGDNIQGTFTVVGSGTENIVNLTLYFGGAQVAFTEGYSLSYRFKTKEYMLGNFNITLIGYDMGGNPYYSTKLVKIMAPTISIIITTGIILLVVVAVSIKYGPRIVNYFKTKRNNN